MEGTELTRRQIQMTVLVTVAFLGGVLAYVFTILPSTRDPVGSRRTAIVCGLVAAFAVVWLVKLSVDAVRDRRRGVALGPAKVSGRFDVIFGAAVAIGGITCSALTYWSATVAGGGVWTLYYGLIAWGLVQMFIGFRRIAPTRDSATTIATTTTTTRSNE